MAIVPRPRGGDWLDDEIRAIKRAGVHLLVSMLTPDEQADMSLSTEAESCRAAGLEYLSVPIPDFGVPSDDMYAPAVHEEIALWFATATRAQLDAIAGEFDIPLYTLPG